LALIPAAIVPILIIIGLLAQYPLMKAMRMNMKESGDKQSVLVESLLNLELIKSHRAEDYLQRRWDFSNSAAAQAYKRARSLTNLMMGLTAMLQQLVTVAIIVAGVYMIGQNTLTLGALIASVILAGRAISPLGNVMALAARYQQAVASLHTLEHLMQRPRDRQRDRQYVMPDKVDGGLNSVELEFAYPDEHKIPVIKRVSLDLNAGTRMALLGRVGSGKSTLLRLMSGLYTPLGGHVMVDGVDLQQIDPNQMRHHVGYVGQDAQLFMGSIRDNLVLSDNRISDAQIIDVLKKLDLYALVANHPRGLDMPLFEAGGGLSGGQRQLLAIARMMLRNPQFVFMDEPTSHMDQQSEKRVIDVLQQWLVGRTVLLATHRLQLLTWVDQITVLERGVVIAQGPRDEVLKQLTVGIAAPAKRASRTAKKSAGEASSQQADSIIDSPPVSASA
jgi:ATP-binding cassette subfamily C protein LapB